MAPQKDKEKSPKRSLCRICPGNLHASTAIVIVDSFFIDNFSRPKSLSDFGLLLSKKIIQLMNEVELTYKKLLEPSDDLVSEIAELDGDILILGVGGKMRPVLARVANQAVDKAGINKKITGVARFSEPGLREELNSAGIETICADLLLDDQLQALPDTKNVLYLAGTKFGTTGNESFTWAMNSYLPGRIA